MRHPQFRRRVLMGDQAADLAAEFDEAEFERRVEHLCLGPVADGSRTLADAAHRLHSFAVWLVELEEDGWQLIHEAEEAHLHLVNSNPAARLKEPELNEA